jgi:glycolate oxidase iron-sulfur subunit
MITTSKPGSNFFADIPVPDDTFLRQCIHCGFCLSSCPTYALTAREISSPRGRIRMIKNIADGKTAVEEIFMREMFFCLDCRACETACPPGVQYGALVEAARAQVEHVRALQSGGSSRIKNFLLGQIFMQPARLRRAAKLLRFYQRSGLEKLALALRLPRLLGKRVMALAPMAPRIEAEFTFEKLPEKLSPPDGKIKHRVALLVGCVQDVAFASINEDTAAVLVENSCEVLAPRAQVCCGSLHGHTGDLANAKILAKKNIEVFEALAVEAIIVNAAGCGSFMKTYGHLFADDPAMRARAENFAGRVKDISEYLTEIGFKKPPQFLTKRATYHDACHLAHGQKIAQQPRDIVRALAGENYVELHEASWCCGSAGIYNLTHFETSMQLLERKMKNIQASGAKVVVSGNPGCAIQLQHGSRRFCVPIEVVHPATLLRQAYDAAKK